MKSLYILLCYSIVQVNADWVDPHAMDFKIKQSIRKPNTDPPTFPESADNRYCTKGTCEADIYFRRAIRMLLSNAYFDKEGAVDHYTGHLKIKLRTLDYDFLTAFSKNENTNEEALPEVHAILEAAFRKTKYEHYIETLISIQEQIYLILFNQASAMLACTAVSLYICYQLLKANFSLKAIIKYIVVIGFIFDFFATFKHLVEALEIENMVNIKMRGNIPPECDKQKMSLWAYFFKSDDCKAYYQATHQNVMYLVTPFKVFAHQFGVLIVKPMTDIGAALGSFGGAMYSSLPWGIGVVLFPIMWLMTLGLVFMIFVFLTKAPVSVNFFHLINFDLNKHQNLPKSITYVTQHRPMLEDVKYKKGADNKHVLKKKQKEEQTSKDRKQKKVVLEKETSKKDLYKGENEKCSSLQMGKQKDNEEVLKENQEVRCNSSPISDKAVLKEDNIN